MLSRRVASLLSSRALSLRLQQTASSSVKSFTSSALRSESGYASTSQYAAGSSRDLPPSLLRRQQAKSTSASPAHATIAKEDGEFGKASTSASPVEGGDGGASSAENSEGPGSDTFQSLKQQISYPIYKALTEKPFHFTKMSTVQEAVLGLLPELAHPSARGGAAKEGERSAERGNRDIATDVLVKAKTGTGKTLAFLVPAIEGRLKDIEQHDKAFRDGGADKHSRGRENRSFSRTSVGTVILSPTRELATQIANEAVRLTHHLRDFETQLWIGGASKFAQMRNFRRGRRDIIVSTPGRMGDMLNEPEIAETVGKAKMLIFDEADTLLDMGFKDEIERIVKQLPPKEERQTFMFSATVSKVIRAIARNTLKARHTFIDTVPANEANAHLHIPQYFSVVKPEEQIQHILRLLAQDAYLNPEGGKAIVFLPTTKMTELMAVILNSMRPSLPWGRGTKVYEMHSKKTQNARDRTADMFRKASGPGYSILVTSDVSARGVDYPGTTRVIQVGIPSNKENYVHRLGRTGRAGKHGRGDIVLLPWERDYVPYELQDMPLKNYPTAQLTEEVEQLASEFDANPVTPKPAAPIPVPSYSQRKRYGASAALPPSSISVPSLPRVQDLSTRLSEEVLPELAESEVQEAFASQLGFYMGHAHELRTRKSDILAGLQAWSTSGMGLAEAPYVSPAFLKKIGMGSDRQRSGGFGGGRGGGYGDRRDFGGRDGGGGGRFERRSEYGAGRPMRSNDRRDRTSSYSPRPSFR